MSFRPGYLPLSIPKEFENELLTFHGDPFIWWAGQILYYITQFNNDFQKKVQEKANFLGFENSCVG